MSGVRRSVRSILVVTPMMWVALGCAGATPSASQDGGPSPSASTAAPIASAAGSIAASPPPTSAPTVAPATSEPCIESGDQQAINASLQSSDSAVLCPGAVFNLTAPVMVVADGQRIYTAGHPTDDTRATLRIVSASQTAAVVMRDYSGVVLSNVIIDGNRRHLGPRSGDALVYAGGYADGQVIRDTRIMNTRSWSSLHLIQGHSSSQACTNALVEDNEIGPAGTSDELLWADGISLACSNSTVRRNLIVDATDGGIVIFGAPGSLVEHNTIRAETRTLLGGINMVDFDPYDGSYAGTVVRDNVIAASGAVIRIGLGMGPRVWGCLPSNASNDTVRGGTVTGNTLKGPLMQYGYAVDGVRDWTVTGNVDRAKHSGRPSMDCDGNVAARPDGFQLTPARAQGVFQPEFMNGRLDLALWAIVAPRPGS